MSEQASTFWRRLDWRLWRHAYITKTTEAERLAWVRPHDPSDRPPWSGTEERFPAQVRDLSLGGIMLLVKHRFESGTLLRIELQHAVDQAPRLLLARVIHLTTPNEGEWLLSCCFARELSADDLRAFGVERIRSETTEDVRTWVRFPCEVELYYRSVTSAEYRRWRAKVLNLAPGGLGIQVSQPLDPGTLLFLELLDPSGQRTHALQARVVHVNPQPGGDWLLGCSFVSELSDEDVQALMAQPEDVTPPAP